MKRIRRILALAWLAACAAAAAAETTRYAIYTGDGTRAGEQVVERADDGWTTVRYVFKDNGRGPELTERYRLAADGTYAEYRSQGKSEMGGAIDESYRRDGARAQWQSQAEAGDGAVEGAALYVPLNGSFDPASVAIASLARRGAASVPLLPSGTLTQQVLDEAELTRDGQTRRVQLVAHTGFALQPYFQWATAGDTPRLFATLIPGALKLVEEGWEGHIEALEGRQQAAEARLLRDLAAKLRRPLPGLTAIRNARVYDSARGRLDPARSDVYVLRDRITAVVPAGTLAQQADTEIDAAGRVLLPGLYDMHGHVARWEGVLNLAAGVTTVRDMGNRNDDLQRILDETARGELLMPHVVPAGFLEGASPYFAQSGITIRTEAEAKAAVDWYAARGYPQLKIYNSFPRALLPGIVAYAHRRGMRVSGHVPAFMRASEAVEAGYDEIQHINQVLLNFLVTPTTDTRTLERFYLPARRLADLDFDAKPVRDFVALLQRRRTVIDPTLASTSFIAQRDREVSAPYAAVIDHLPPLVQRDFRSGQMEIPDDATAARFRASYAKMVEFVGRLYRAGVPLVAGTDDLPGFALHAELALYVKAGLTPAQALQIATRNGARYSRTEGDRGRIAAGLRADLVLVDGDPTRDIADLRRVALVITQGHSLVPAELHRAIGVRPFDAQAPTLKP